MAGKHIEPTISKVAFNCPHCGALADQSWFNVYVEPLDRGSVPFRATPDRFAEFNQKFSADEHESLRQWMQRIAEGDVFLEPTGKSLHSVSQISNVSISECYSCDAISVWIRDSVAFPPMRFGVEPNSDLPADVLRDYDEARVILDQSPRGAAALLRLGIQKLCAHLGEKGENINNDIASLVRKGLDSRVQKALDIVRVIGNEAVHPGQIDLRDDRDTATKLFGLVNLIAEKMISEPKHVEALYASLPQTKREAIEKRDR